MDRRKSRGEFFGSLLEKREVCGMTLTDYSYPAMMSVQKHRHESPYFCVVLQGGYDERFDAHERQCRPATVTFHPAGELHSDRFHRDGGRIFSVEVDPAWELRLGQALGNLTRPAAVHGGRLASLVLKMFREFQIEDSASDLAIEGLSLEVCAEVARSEARERTPPRWLRRVVELIHEHFRERLTLERLAGEAGVHPVHLVREFRRHSNCTIGDYIRELRIADAAEQLIRSGSSISDIALAAGFAHQSHFSKVFKRTIGLTPAEFRRNGRDNC